MACNKHVDTGSAMAVAPIPPTAQEQTTELFPGKREEDVLAGEVRLGFANDRRCFGSSE